MAATYNVYINPNTVTLGSATMFGVQSIDIQQTPLGGIVSSGDDDAFAQVDRPGAVTTVITITTDDIADAHAWVGASGTLGATYDDAVGGAALTLSVVSCSVKQIGHSINHNGKGVGTVIVGAESADGDTNPVSLS